MKIQFLSIAALAMATSAVSAYKNAPQTLSRLSTWLAWRTGLRRPTAIARLLRLLKVVAAFLDALTLDLYPIVRAAARDNCRKPAMIAKKRTTITSRAEEALSGLLRCRSKAIGVSVDCASCVLILSISLSILILQPSFLGPLFSRIKVGFTHLCYSFFDMWTKVPKRIKVKQQDTMNSAKKFSTQVATPSGERGL